MKRVFRGVRAAVQTHAAAQVYGAAQAYPTARRCVAAGLAAVAWLAAGCSTPYRSVDADVDAEAWNAPVELTLPNTDTLGSYDWQFFVRSDERIAPDTFTVRIAVVTPDSLRFEEPFAVQLPVCTTPAARLCENLLDYRRRVRLSRTGDYRLTIRPVRPLRGIEAVGIQTVESD